MLPFRVCIDIYILSVFFFSLHSSTAHETAQPGSVPKAHKTMGKPNHHWLWLRSQEKKTITTSLSHTISARVLFFFSSSFSAEAMIAARGTATTATRNEMTRNGKKWNKMNGRVMHAHQAKWTPKCNADWVPHSRTKSKNMHHIDDISIPRATENC